jgi:glycerate dehydrogenase
VAQVAFAHVLAHMHAVERHTASVVQERRWSAGPDWSYTVTPQTEMAGKTLGVVGFGQIGQQIARVAMAFGMHVQVHSRTEKTVSGLEAAEWVGLNEVFETSDVLVLACPETPETRGMVNARTLARMKRSALLVNVARGGLVVEEDLAAALNTGQLAGAGVDVLASEPPDADNVLLQAKNLTVTPHVAWGTFEARTRLLQEAAENLRAFLDGERRNRVV